MILLRVTVNHQRTLKR